MGEDSMRYNLQMRIGELGGFGCVYKCVDENGYEFACKVFEYSYAAEPPVQFRLSHLSRRSEPL